MKDSEQDDLSAKLKAWTVEPQVPGSFSRKVWQRIAARQAEREEAFWPKVGQWFNIRIARPQYAAALFAITFSASIGVAHLQAHGANAKHWKTLEARYAASIDPLAMGR